MVGEELKNVITALLFVHAEPCELAVLTAALEGEATEEDIRAAAEELVAASTSALMVQPLAGGWQMRTNPRYAPFVRRMLKNENERRLSSAAQEVLAAVAFKQPVTRDEIEAMRGVDCSGVLHALLEKKLLGIIGKKQPGGAHLYGTTKQFLTFMGLNSLADLPRPDDHDAAVLAESAQEPKGT